MEHMAASPDFDTRLAARQLLMEEYNSEAFADKEAGIGDGEEMEPRVVPR